MSEHSVKIYGNASNVQIQQGSIDSSQTFDSNSINDSDVEYFREVIDMIKRYDRYFESEFGDKSSDMLEALNQAKEALDKKDDSLWKKALGVIRDISIGTSGSLIASGIMGLITPLL